MLFSSTLLVNVQWRIKSAGMFVFDAAKTGILIK